MVKKSLFQEEYILRCRELGVSLSDRHYVENFTPLKRVLVTISNEPSPPRQRVDGPTLKEAYYEDGGSYQGWNGMYGAIAYFVENKEWTRKRQSAFAFDDNALAMYNVCLKILEISTTRQPLHRYNKNPTTRHLRNQIPSFTNRDFRVLHAYLHKRDLVENKEHPFKGK
jgi:hypothetical protein